MQSPLTPQREKYLLLTLAGIQFINILDFMIMMPLGPILMGLSKSVHVLQRGSTVEEIVNMAAIAVVDAQKHGLGIRAVPRSPAA